MKRVGRAPRRKPDAVRHELSAEAAALIADGSGRWEHVDLADGPAAQGMVPGVRARPSPAVHETVGAEDERPVDHPDLFGGGKDG